MDFQNQEHAPFVGICEGAFANEILEERSRVNQPFVVLVKFHTWTSWPQILVVSIVLSSLSDG